MIKKEHEKEKKKERELGKEREKEMKKIIKEKEKEKGKDKKGGKEKEKEEEKTVVKEIGPEDNLASAKEELLHAMKKAKPSAKMSQKLNDAAKCGGVEHVFIVGSLQYLLNSFVLVGNR